MESDGGMDSRAARASFRLIPLPFFRVPPPIGSSGLHPCTFSTAPAWQAACGTCKFWGPFSGAIGWTGFWDRILA
jgi:hypothetical protein